MPRLYKLALTGFIAYALVTASPAQQAEIAQGVLAVKDAAVEACTRKDSLCTRAWDYAMSAISTGMSDGPAPWLDQTSTRPAPPSTQSVTVRSPSQP
ncbi:MAG: hypothetical protein MUE84_12320 [Hyphomonas sp.]|jgi:hypothetical protein|nr:hypothetical protein [Hyphomonas sp.]